MNVTRVSVTLLALPVFGLAGCGNASLPAGPVAPAKARPLVHDSKVGITWVSIPGGTFRYGCEPHDTACHPNEKPGQSTSVQPFWLMQTEVTISAYRLCKVGGACTEPGTSATQCNWGRPGRDDHPINCVDVAQATAFCEWLGARLPTGPEWEYAAKSGSSRVFPWGDGEPDMSLAHHAAELTAPVGSHSPGATPWGLEDMAGNVNEWTTDELKPGFAVARGGSFAFPDAGRLRASNRGGGPLTLRAGNFGFRCARAES